MFTQTTGPDWRDVFAQDAMNAMVSEMSPQYVGEHAREIAIAAYTLADEMLAMRKMTFVGVPPTQPERTDDAH